MATDPKKLREFDLTELNLRLAELDKEMFDTRQKLVTKEMTNTARLRDLRRERARLQTIIGEKNTASVSA